MNKKVIYSVIGIVIAVVVIAIAASQASGSGNAAMDNIAVQQSVIARLSTIANNYALANNVGIGAVSGLPIKTNRTTVMKVNGLPAVVYVGADFCPYCAAARWGLIIALDRFGNFTSLHYMTSSASDFAPSTPTFTFFNSSYYSPYITFESDEWYTNKYPYQVLQAPNALESNLFDVFDSNNSALPSDARGGTPFIDFGNITIQVGAEFSPVLIDNTSWSTIIGNLDNLNSTITQAIIGNANDYTAKICQIINNSASVCSQQFVKKLE